jgi:hypothetical protein
MLHSDGSGALSEAEVDPEQVEAGGWEVGAAGMGTGRPESRMSQGSCVSFAGSEIELELCATDCASYLAL